MFQFAAVLGMAKKYNYEVAIPHNKTYYDPNYERNNTSIFDGFDISTPTLELGSSIFNEVEFPFHYIDRKIDDFTDMVGYFQSERYFENAIDEVRAQFKFKQDVKDKIDLSKYPDPSKCTSMHIRLGDYMKKRYHHPVIPTSYWQNAVREAGLDHIVIFSDDIEHAKRMFGEADQIVYSKEQDPFEALYHMSLCKNNILCNSTFGWWGAWLGETNANNKVVAAPEIWFGPGHTSFNPKDIIPDRWLKL
tara:strand:+ start:792 stop:1535 length:744 start_codon:yes stop_codon:yes gene_type:complete